MALSESSLVLLNTAALVVIAGLNAITAWFVHRTRHDVKVLEENTNSKMDEMLELTAKSSRAQGRKEGLETHERLRNTPKR